MDIVLWWLRNWKPKPLGIKIKNLLKQILVLIERRKFCFVLFCFVLFCIESLKAHAHLLCSLVWQGWWDRWCGSELHCCPMDAATGLRSVLVWSQACLNWIPQSQLRVSAFLSPALSQMVACFLTYLEMVTKDFELCHTISLELEYKTYGQFP